MKFFDLCIKRPVLATVLSLVVVLLGLIGYTRLSIREYPKIDEPIVSGVDGAQRDHRQPVRHVVRGRPAIQ